MKKIILALSLSVAVMPLWAQSSANALTKAQEILQTIKEDLAPDGRQVIFGLKAFNSPDGILTVEGTTSEQTIRDSAVEALSSHGVDFADSICVYPSDNWGQVRIPVASLRTAGKHAAEMATQAVMGTPLRILESSGEWYHVQTLDGYIAWVPQSSVQLKTAEDMEKWRKAKRFIVTSPFQIRAYSSADKNGLRDVVTDLLNGCIVEPANSDAVLSNGRLAIKLPDDRRAYVDVSDVAPIEEWAAQNFNPEKILDIAYSMEGTPYLWGGTSTKAIDCSGLAKVSYFANGIILMRDASQQALTGTRIEASDWPNCQAGDLLFFGNPSTRRVTHVAIYDNNGNYVHSSGRVKRNSVDPESSSYLKTPFLHAVRIAGNEETKGITRARNHNWYF